ncbi:hypothetical protein EMIT0P171_50039 [Pseudomonas sp. IT-P171]
MSLRQLSKTVPWHLNCLKTYVPYCYSGAFY